MILGEELAWGCGGIAMAMLTNGLTATAVNLIGTPEQRARFLPMCMPIDGELKLGALALTEPDAGSDAAAIKTRAMRDGDDYVLHGTKRFISLGGIADLTVVIATEEPGTGWKGVSAFAVPKGTPGFTQTHKWRKMGIRASHTADLGLDEVRIPADHRLGPPDPNHRSGGPGVLGTLTGTRPQIGIMAVGIGRAAFEYAANFARQRQTFGQPIIEHQAVASMLADMDIALDASRLLCWRAAWLLSRGEPLTYEEGEQGEVLRHGHGDARDHGCRAGPGRQRLHAGQPGGEVDARRQDLPDLRGYQPDPAPGDRPQHRGAAVLGRSGARGRPGSRRLSVF